MVTTLLLQALVGCSASPASLPALGLPVAPKADPGTPDWTNTSGRTGAR